VAGQSIWELRNEIKKLKQTIEFRDRKLENIKNLCNHYETRLARMAERLTDLAAERNELYAANKECGRVVNRLQDEREELINRLEKVEREAFELQEENRRLEWQLEDAHTIKGSRP